MQMTSIKISRRLYDALDIVRKDGENDTNLVERILISELLHQATLRERQASYINECIRDHNRLKKESPGEDAPIRRCAECGLEECVPKNPEDDTWHDGYCPDCWAGFEQLKRG